MAHHYQETDVFCGAAALQMALEKAGFVSDNQAKLADELGTSLAGTHPEAFEKFLASREISYKAWHGDVSLGDLRELSEDHAVIVCYQSDELGVGHFAMVEELTANEIHLDDPWFGPCKCLPATKFVKQWESRPEKDEPLRRWLLAIPFAGPKTT